MINTQPVPPSGLEADRSERRPGIGSGTVALTTLSLFEAGGRLLLNIVVLSMFGLSTSTDAFFIAQSIPLFISSLMYATYVNGLVPVLARRSHDGIDKRSIIFSTFLNLTFLVGLLMAAVGIIAPSVLTRVMGPGLDGNASTMTVNLIRMLFIALVFGASSELVRAAFYAMRRFAPPSFGGVLRDLTAIAVTIALAGRIGIAAAGLGIVIGSLAQFLVTFAFLMFQSDLAYRLTIAWRDSAVRRAARLAMAPLVGVGTRQLAVLFANAIATFLPTGSVAALNLAFRIVHLITRLFLGSLETALLPVISSDHASGRTDRLSQDLSRGFRLALFIGIPAALGLWLLGNQVTALLFEREHFDAGATQIVGSLLGFFALGVAFSGPARVCMSYFYATLQPRAAVLMHIATSILQVGLLLILLPLMDLNGFGLAFSLGVAISAIAAIGYVRKQVEAPFAGIGLSFLIKIVGISLVMTTVATVVLAALSSVAHPWARPISVIATSAAGVIGYGLASRMLLPTEFFRLYQPVTRKTSRVLLWLHGLIRARPLEKPG